MRGKCILVASLCFFVAHSASAGRLVAFSKSLGLSNPLLYADVLVQNNSPISQSINLQGVVVAMNPASAGTIISTPFNPWNCINTNGTSFTGCTSVSGNPGFYLVPAGATMRFSIANATVDGWNRSTGCGGAACAPTDGFSYMATGTISILEDRGAITANGWFEGVDAANHVVVQSIEVNGGRPF